MQQAFVDAFVPLPSSSVSTGALRGRADAEAAGGQRRLLLVQCDPCTSSQAHTHKNSSRCCASHKQFQSVHPLVIRNSRQALIDHARHCCELERQKAKASAAGCDAQVVFVLHLPPGIRGRDRFFRLDLFEPWAYCFVDDLREPSAAERFGSTFELMRR